MDSQQILVQFEQYLMQRSDVVVVWLYGSRAKGNAADYSDWDLAVAFSPRKLPDVLDNRLRPELLALDLQRDCGLPEGAVSVIDVNLAPTPLVYAAIYANHIVYTKDKGRQMQEEARIMSKMELEYRPQKSL